MITEEDVIFDNIMESVQEVLVVAYELKWTLIHLKETLILDFNLSNYWADKCISHYLENNSRGGDNEPTTKKQSISNRNRNEHSDRIVLDSVNQ